jgi:hypothetical protein
MNLQENISRIKKVMYVISEDEDYTKLLNRQFDKVFNKLTTTSDEGYVKWFRDNDEDEVFGKNWWGNFWVHDCDEYGKISQFMSHFSLNKDKFHKLLMNYLNNKYQTEFGDRPIKAINPDDCIEDYFD